MTTCMSGAAEKLSPIIDRTFAGEPRRPVISTLDVT
jgi:hypothetical protein